MFVVFDTDTMMTDLRHAGTISSIKERLKVFVNASASCSANFLSTRPGTPSGITALRELNLCSVSCTSYVLSLKLRGLLYSVAVIFTGGVGLQSKWAKKALSSLANVTSLWGEMGLPFWSVIVLMCFHTPLVSMLLKRIFHVFSVDVFGLFKYLFHV